jgi:FMN phosphatase YigB (HAD superfamily)
LRIAIDIDSTLHHYWDQFAAAAKRRFGVDLPYRDQMWRIEALRPEQVQACVEETHRDAQILAAEPYPGAVETIAAWHEAGHYIHITTHRRADAHSATQQWLDRIGLVYDDLYCSGDKLSRAKELGIELMIDDSPVNLLGAIESGMRAATIAHPWNREICEEEDIVCGADWAELAERLAPLLDQAKA